MKTKHITIGKADADGLHIWVDGVRIKGVQSFSVHYLDRNSLFGRPSEPSYEVQLTIAADGFRHGLPPKLTVWQRLSAWAKGKVSHAV